MFGTILSLNISTLISVESKQKKRKKKTKYTRSDFSTLAHQNTFDKLNFGLQ